MAICMIDNRVATKWINTGMPISSGSMYYNEPLQGCTNDCFFIAALSAVAHAANTRLKIFPNYQFYDTVAKNWIPITTDSNLNVDNGNNLVYARTSSGYIWPCLYEKAYAIWKSGQQQPTMNTLWPTGQIGNPLTALWEICGGNYYSFIKSGSSPAFTLPYQRSGKTTYPTVALTKEQPADTRLAGNHSYTVTRKSGAGWELRNPCGGGLIWIGDASLSTANFSDWGYVIP